MKTGHLPFFVREQIHSRILKRVEALEKGYRQNVGLIGPKGRGKTASLHAVFSFLEGKSTFIPVYVDARTLDYDHLVERWLGAMLAGLFVAQSVPPPGTFQSLLNAAEMLVPKTVAHIRELKKTIRRGKIANSVRELFAATHVLSEETGKKIVLMIDEFQELENLPAPDPFGLLGKEIMVEKNTLYLVASSSPVKAHEIFRDKLSLLFGNFEIVELKPFGFRESADFLKQYFADRSFTPLQKKFLIRMTDGNPVYLDLLMDRLKNSAGPRSQKEDGAEAPPEAGILTSQILDAFSLELYGSHGRIALLFKQRIDLCERLAKDSGPYVKTLLAVGHGRRKELGIAAFIGKKNRETKKILQRLLQEDMLVKRGSFYLLGDPLFSFWMREVFQRANQLYTPDDSSVHAALTGALQKEYEKTQEEEGFDITSRVEALFKEFRNDLIEIDRKKLRLPQFSEIAFRPTNGRVFPLLARNPKVRWLCQIAQQPVCEEDVLVFLEELKRFRKNVQRKIMVTLAGIDQNAKLMAQQAQIQLWDLRNFNTLLDLYDLPKIIFVSHEENYESNLGAVAQGVHSS